MYDDDEERIDYHQRIDTIFSKTELDVEAQNRHIGFTRRIMRAWIQGRVLVIVAINSWRVRVSNRIDVAG